MCRLEEGVDSNHVLFMLETSIPYLLLSHLEETHHVRMSELASSWEVSFINGHLLTIVTLGCRFLLDPSLGTVELLTYSSEFRFRG